MTTNIVFLADYYRRLPWLRDEKRFERRFAAGMAVGIGSTWLVALCTAFCLSDDEAERDRIGTLACARGDAECVDVCDLLDRTDELDGTPGLRDWTLVARLLSGLVAREAGGEDTSEVREHMAQTVHRAMQRRWASDARAIRRRRLERQERHRVAAPTPSARARQA